MAALFSVTLILTLTKSTDYVNMQFKNVLRANIFCYFFVIYIQNKSYHCHFEFIYVYLFIY